jgi:hypothetical protein
MNIKDETLLAVAAAIRAAIKVAADDIDLATVALQSFADNASLDDWDQMEAERDRGR